MFNAQPVARVAELSASTFIQCYKRPQKPVVITDITDDWPARRKWSVDYLKAAAGDQVVPLYNSRPATQNQHQHAAAAYKSLREYLSMLEAGESDLRLFFYNILAGVPTLASDFRYPDIGLRFFKKLPVLFIGGRGARVQMHFDIDLADTCLCHFGGTKQVLLFSPAQTRHLYHVPYSFSSLFAVDFTNPDWKRFPALQHLQAETAQLQHGDVLYIPSGYWHFIVYEDIGFSISLRAFPKHPLVVAKMLRNVFFIRTVDALMRRFIGQPWVERNEQLAITNTHRYNS